MAFLVRNHLFLEKKMVFGGLLLVKPPFSRQRWFFEGWLLKTIFFSRKRWFRTKKPSFSRENQKKPKTTKKTSFPKLWGWGLQKMCFFWSSREKDVFLVRNHLFLEKKMVFGGLPLVKTPFLEKRWFVEGWLLKTIFFSRKRLFRTKKPSFSRKIQKNKKNPKKTIFSKTMGLGPPKMFFWGFSREKKGVFGSKPSFFREKDGFWRSSPGKTIFFSRKRWFFEGLLLKTIFS